MITSANALDSVSPRGRSTAMLQEPQVFFTPSLRAPRGLSGFQQLGGLFIGVWDFRALH